MRTKYLISMIVAVLVMISTADAQSRFDDITTVVQKYLDGTSQGNPDLVSEAFLPSLEVQWLGEDDKLMRRPGPEYISRIKKNESVPRIGRIVSIDATERSAVVKVEIAWNDRIYTDYMLMLKVEGEWKITNKIATWIQNK